MKIIRSIVLILSVSFFLINLTYAQTEAGIDISEQPVYYNLKKALRNKEVVYRLNLSNNELEEFPEEIFELKELRRLYLDSNKIAAIPEDIRLLEKLEVFSIANNNILTIPSSIGKLQEVFYLDISNNKLIGLPPELFYLHNLQKLYINNISLNEFNTDFKNLKELMVLVAENNEIEIIPNEIGHLYNLRDLDLSNNHIKALPIKFYELTNLEFLYLYGNELTKIDSNIVKLKKLELVNLGNNKIKTVPPEIGKLQQLRMLYLANNEMEDFPANIKNLINLSVLSLYNNPIKNLPTELVSLKSLKRLYLEGNMLSPFPQLLYDLQNKGVKISGIVTNELYDAKLLLSKARNKKLIGNYSEAIEKYIELLQLDTNNIQAMSELAYSYLENGDFDLAEAICERALAKNPDDELTGEIQSIYDNSTSKTNKLVMLNDEYEAKFKKDSSDVTPYFDLGKHYYSLKKYNDAIIYFQKAVKLDPSYANSHFYLAVISLIQKQDTIFIFSTIRYLILEQNGRKAKTILPFLFNKLKMKTGVEEKNGGTSYFDSYIIKDDNGNIIYESENPTADLLGAMLFDLTKSDIYIKDAIENDTIVKELVLTTLHTNETNVEIFQSELGSICKSDFLDAEPNFSLCKDYYLPYFTNLIANGHLETLAYIINSIRNGGESDSAIWLVNNSKKVDEFNIWSQKYKWNSVQSSPGNK